VAFKKKSQLPKVSDVYHREQSEKLAQETGKPLLKGRDSANVLFAENKASANGGFSVAQAPKQKSFKLTVGEHPLDVYLSPFLLDLSKSGKLEKEFTFSDPPETAYADLPGGAFLEKHNFFAFWELDKSEILIAFKKIWRLIDGWRHGSPKLSGKLAKESVLEEKKQLVIQISFVSFGVFVYRHLKEAYLTFKTLFYLLGWYLARPFIKDETVWLDSKPTDFNQPAKKTESLFTLPAYELTITEILAKNKNVDNTYNSTISKEIIDKIVENPKENQAADSNLRKTSAKEVRQKYLENNFTRKGVVLNPQKLSAPWPKDNWSFFSNFEFKRPKLKPATAFLGILLALVCSVKVMSYVDDLTKVKGKVLGEAEEAVQNIGEAGSELKKFSLPEAQKKLVDANNKFNSAKKQLEEINFFVTVLAEISPAQNTFKSGKNLLDLGERLSSAGEHLLNGINAISTQPDLSLTSRINNFGLELSPALEDLKAAQENIDNIGLSYLPAEAREKFGQLKENLPLAIESMEKLKAAVDFSAQVLGDRDLRRYLFVFQNDNELRATGGFMGSFALVDFKFGQIEKITIPQGGTYDVRAGFNERLAPPDALRLVSSRWEFQDANWWPDFPTSAKNIKWFYEKSGGPTVDGVFAINSTWLKELLKVTGPIALPSYGKTIDENNFEMELQKSIELEAKDKAKPKKILSELAPKILEKILATEPEKILPLAEAVGAGLKQKDIMVYFNDVKLQEFALANNWAGQFKDAGADSDYLSVISTNLNGGKTDDVIDQKIWQRAEIQADGSILDYVMIDRNSFGPTDEFFTNQVNNSYIRVYAPLGSQLLKAVGFDNFKDSDFKKLEAGLEVKPEIAAENNAAIEAESGTRIYEENGKTVFANFSKLDPGGQKEILLVYKLPFRLSGRLEPSGLINKTAALFSTDYYNYGILIQKQPGRNQDKISSEVLFADNYKPALSYPAAAVSGNKIIFEGDTKNDNYFGISFAVKK